MANRIVVDPVTRIEGHLRIEAEIKDGKIVDAYSSSTMVRGIEQIVKGRDPRDVWAFVQRTCGVCTTVHALASVRAVEDALGIASSSKCRNGKKYYGRCVIYARPYRAFLSFTCFRLGRCCKLP